MRKIFSLFVVALFAMGAMADMYLPGTWDGTFSAGNDSRYKFEDSRLTLTLEANTTYEFKFYDDSKSDAMKWFGLNSTMTSGNSTGWWFYYKDKNNCKITTTYAGEYVFIINGWADDTSNGNDWCPVLSAVYPDASAVESNHLFATYQKSLDVFTKTDGTDPKVWALNYYIVSCGQKVLLRAKSAGDLTFDGAGWATQLRVNAEGAGQVEIQAQQIVDSKHHYTGSTSPTTIATTKEDLRIHFFAFCNGQGHRKTADFNYNRKSINNPISDAVAPTINPEEVQVTDNGDGTYTIVFGDVTADDEYFYYIADEEHNLGYISLDNTITITMPTRQDGVTYNFSCCAVDYNGNMSEAKEFSYTTPFDTNLNLALNQPSEAGTQQNDGVRAPKANNGNETDFWTCFNTGTSDQWWWSVDLGENYDVNRVRILFNDRAGTFQILSSVNGSDWSVYASEGTEYAQDITYNVLASARYFKFVSTAANVGIKEFEVYGIGVHVEDTQAPVLTAAAVDNATITDNAATINVTATDNVAVAACHLVDTANNFDGTFDFNSGVVALTNLAPSTTYTFTVTVADLAGNVSAPIVMTAFTTLANTHIPSIAAPVPTKAKEDVLSLYSDAYESIGLKSTNSWGGLPVSNGNIQGDNYLLYKVTKEGMDNGIEFKDRKSISEYRYMHVDVWSEVDATITFTVADASCASLALTAQRWTSADLAIPAGAPAEIQHIKLNQWRGDINVNIAVDNIYFWKLHNLALGNGGYSTFCALYNYTVSGATAYKVASLNGETVSLAAIDDGAVIAARQGIILNGTTGDYVTITPSTESATVTETGLFGTTAPTAQEEGYAYYGITTKVINGEDVTGFAKASSTLTLPAGKAFLKVAASGAPARLDMTVLDRPNNPITTGVEQVTLGEGKKMLVRGQLVIIRGSKMYDMNGRLIK